MTDKERLLLTELVDNIRDQFITAVAEGRNIKADKVREIADGRIFSGEMALKLGLVDQLGNFQDAVDLTKSLTGIEDEVDLVFPSKSRVRLMDLFFQKAADTMTRLLYNEFKGSIQYKWSNDFRGMN